MACKATLRADEVLDAHKARMEQIETARQLSLMKASDNDISDPSELYTEKDMKRDKLIAYLETGVGFARLYGPAFAVGMGGIGLMEAAFITTERRRASAVAALTSLDSLFNEYKARVEDKLGPEALELEDVRHEKILVKAREDSEDDEKFEGVVLDGSHTDPFSFIFDETCDGWGGKNSYTINERVLTCPIDSWNYALGTTKDHVWMNNILNSWGDVKTLDGEHVDETDFGANYGWNSKHGDIIDYDIKPYLYLTDENGFTAMVETDKDTIDHMEHQDVQSGYCFMITLKSSNPDMYGDDRKTQPRMIYNEVFGH